MSSTMSSIGSPRPHCGPISLESERRKAMNIVFAIEKQSNNFRENYLMGASDENNETWLHFISFLRSKAGMKKCKTHTEFAEHFETVKKQNNVAKQGEKIIPEIEEILDRARKFDDLMKNAKKKLKKALEEHLSRYCISFYDKLRGQEVQVVMDYENQIGQWESEVRSFLTELRGKCREFKENEGHSFESYIHNYEKLLQLMEEILDILPNIFDIYKSWVIADEAYPRKLLDEINRYLNRKEEITDTFRQFHRRSEESASKIRKVDYSSKKVNDKLQNGLKERRICRKMEMTLQDKINILEDEIREKQKELEDGFYKMNSKQNLSTPAYKTLLDKTQKIQLQLPKLEKMVKAMNENMIKLKKQRYKVQKDVHKLQVTYEKSVKATRRVREVACKDENNAKHLMDEQKAIVMQLSALKRVREIKIHPLTVKKIYAGENHQGHDLDVSGMYVYVYILYG